MVFQPDGASLRVDVPLTNVSIKYQNLAYIADGLFPPVPVQKQSAIVPKYRKSDWFRDAAELRGKGTKSAGGGWEVDLTDTYFCPRYSYRKEIADEDRDNSEAPFNLDLEATEFVTDKMQMRREVNFASGFFKTGVWTGDKVGGVDFTVFSNYASSVPLQVISEYMDDVEVLIGREPNTMVMGKQVWNKLRWHPDLVDLIKYTQRGMITQELMQSMFEVAKMPIGRATYTTTAEGTTESSVTYTRIWGKNILLMYVPDRASLMTPAAGYTFIWQRVPAAFQYMKRFRDDEREVDIIEGNSYFTHKATAADAGKFLSGAVA